MIDVRLWLVGKHRVPRKKGNIMRILFCLENTYLSYYTVKYCRGTFINPQRTQLEQLWNCGG